MSAKEGEIKIGAAVRVAKEVRVFHITGAGPDGKSRKPRRECVCVCVCSERRALRRSLTLPPAPPTVFIPGYNLEGNEGVVVSRADDYEGRPTPANLPYKVKFQVEVEGKNGKVKTLKTFAHLTKAELERCD